MRINGVRLPSLLCRVLILAVLSTNVGCMIGNGWALNRAGIRQYNRGNYVVARKRFCQALRHDPCNPDYRHNLAMAIQQQGNSGACEQILRYNLTIDAMHQPTYHSLAQLMVVQGRAPEAQDLVTTWVATQPYVPEANIEMAWVQRETGDIPGAEQSLQNALRTDPYNHVALAHLGQLYHSAGRPDQAAVYYQRSLASNWNQPEVQSRLSTLVDDRPMTRSALMQNPIVAPMMAGEPMGIGSPIMAEAPVMMPEQTMIASSGTTIDPLPIESSPQTAVADPLYSAPVPRPRRHRRGRDNDPVIASYQQSNLDPNGSGWIPAGSSITGPPFGTRPTPIVPADAQTMVQLGAPPLTPPQLSDSIATPYVSRNTLATTVQADPAHSADAATEMTASLPIVDPH